MRDCARLCATARHPRTTYPHDDVIQNILGPESAYLRGHQQPDNPPTFARGPDADEESNESTQSVFVQENILSVAGI